VSEDGGHIKVSPVATDKFLRVQSKCAPIHEIFVLDVQILGFHPCQYLLEI
jgi:hypothetical protein